MDIVCPFKRTYIFTFTPSLDENEMSSLTDIITLFGSPETFSCHNLRQDSLGRPASSTFCTVCMDKFLRILCLKLCHLRNWQWYFRNAYILLQIICTINCIDRADSSTLFKFRDESNSSNILGVIKSLANF